MTDFQYGGKMRENPPALCRAKERKPSPCQYPYLSAACIWNSCPCRFTGGSWTAPVTAALVRLLESAAGGEEQALCARWGELCRVLLQRGRLDSLPAAVAQEILEDENPFSIRLAAGALPDAADPDRMAEAARRDLDVLYRAATIRPETLCAALETGLSARLPDWGVTAAAVPLDTPWGDALPALAAYHAAHGCGRFAAHRAFLWRDGALHPVEHPDPIRLSDLKDYAAQRQIAVDNTLAFLDGFEANNMLLYGDRGTGKSSTVKALLNEYAGRGLRMIELPKETLRELPELTGFLAGLPMKFILFIDDLSFSGNDDSFAALKAVLEGGLASRPVNVLVYATSNRRHLLRETFRDRDGDEVHAADTVQEAVSLSDRFGISLTFLMPDKRRFLDIVAQIAADRHLEVERETLLAAAEQWALERGARSPRYARQFVADAEARLARGESLL